MFKNFCKTVWEKIKMFWRFITFDPSAVSYTQKQVIWQIVAKTLLFSFALSYFEFILQMNTTGSINWKFIYPVILSLPFGLLFTLLTSFFRKGINYVLSWVLLIASYLFMAAQLTYYKIFGSFISFSLMKMGGQAIKNFWPETYNAVIVNYIPLLIMALPLLLYGLTAIKGVVPKFNFRHRNWKVQLITFGALIPTYLLSLCSLFIGGTGHYTPYDAYFNSDTTTEFSLNTIGAFSTMVLELVSAGGKSANLGAQLSSSSSNTDKEESVPPLDTTLYTSANYNMLDIDFETLNEQTEDKDIQMLNNYFKTVVPTEKNAYTGKFSGYNLITICAESYSPYLIDPQVMPTLYKLANGGFVFNNFYNSYQSVTTNGEYTFCMGLFPDLSRNKSDGSFKASSNNLLPFCLGNVFESNGVNAYGYHNYRGTYYSRRTSHPNMGYAMKFMEDGMEFTSTWPTSDLEMMQQSIDDYINEPNFHAYYMTFSGHYRYSFSSNPMCKRNEELARQLVGDRNYSEPVLAYIACNLELEKALSYLVERLEQKGILDKTVIVLTGDHYPYGLNYNQYNELAGHEVDTKFAKFESSFICYNSAMEPVIVDTPCATPDILPTLLNLFGFSYDSRLLAGTDVLSANKEHVAVLSNQSFVTDKVKFDSGSNQVEYLVDEHSIASDYVEDNIKLIKQKMTFSAAILNNDYYRFVYESLYGKPEESTLDTVSSAS
ncbi:MAG: LTA synthase family protein [Clostridia bacterium]|nr:LTA synthase family protein [Clostridia bacterium]